MLSRSRSWLTGLLSTKQDHLLEEPTETHCFDQIDLEIPATTLMFLTSRVSIVEIDSLLCQKQQNNPSPRKSLSPLTPAARHMPSSMTTRQRILWQATRKHRRGLLQPKVFYFVILAPVAL